MTLSSIDDDLDELALKRLVLLDELLKTKAMLAEFMKDGYFQMGCARYSLGQHAVSGLRIPETHYYATCVTVRNEQKDDSGKVTYDSVELMNGQGLEEEESSNTDDEPILASRKPINWFSALPPPSLRQAQNQFQSALQVATTCVTLQLQLKALNEKFQQLKGKFPKDDPVE